MTAQIEGQQQASRNANDGISMAQTAEGTLDELNVRLLRIRSKARTSDFCDDREACKRLSSFIRAASIGQHHADS